MRRNKHSTESAGATRRDFLTATGTTLASFAAVGGVLAGKAAHAASGADAKAQSTPATRDIPQAPFDSIRDYIAALEARGLLLRIPRIDQDRYQTTALLFRAIDKFGTFNAPAMLFENVKQDGVWRQGPVLANHQGHWYADAIVWGLEPVPGDGFATYRRAKAHMYKLLDANGGSYPLIPPVEIARERAPCKEVVLTGDEIDLLEFPFLKTNPADGGRYVNTGSVFTSDPKMGRNFGTYRSQITGPRKLSVNSEKNHVGYKTWMAARERGEKTAKVSIALGQDPVVWMLSGAPIARRGEEPVDELAMAGGMRGKALQVVKSDTNDYLVPAHAEMIIEGEVPLQDPLVKEGPFGEMFGYLGPQKEAVFTLNVTRITHRRNPWFLNSYTGMHRGYITAPIEAMYDRLLRRMIPNLVEFHYPQDIMGVAFLSIDKTAPGQGLEAGRKIANRIPICKVIVVVDKELNVLDRTQMLFAMGSRWQPYPAAEILKDAPGIITDPSTPVPMHSSKIVVDATKQWPEEGGPKVYPERNRVLLENGAPESFQDVDEQFGAMLKSWRPVDL
jgi:4-hydroxy-3-polyprenylbenzoate decarboxylase